MIEQFYRAYVDELYDALNRLDVEMMGQIYRVLDDARREGRQVFVLGNGGSAAAATHWLCDFAKGVNAPGSARMRIFSLADSVSLVTAVGNDCSYGRVFEEPLRNYLREGDVVLSLSVSGKSENLVAAHEVARQMKATTIAIIGDYSGPLGQCSDLVLTIPSKNYGVVEDVHLSIDHIMSQYMHRQNTADARQ